MNQFTELCIQIALVAFAILTTCFAIIITDRHFTNKKNFRVALDRILGVIEKAGAAIAQKFTHSEN